MRTALHLLAASAIVFSLGCSDGAADGNADHDGGVADTRTGPADDPREPGSDDAGSDDALDSGTAPPEQPPGLVTYLTGNPDDAVVQPGGPGVVLMGGSTEVDAAFEWWRPLIANGDVVILRTSGADGYNDYLFHEIGGCDSVETLLVTSRELAASPYVGWVLRHAEGIFLAGGDQSTYLESWHGTPVATALTEAWTRGAVVGGTSAGCAVLGELIFAAYQGSVTSSEVLADPYRLEVQLDRDFIALPPLAGVITDTHFRERDRMGRLVGFLGRLMTDGWHPSPLGLGVDERTALVIDATGLGQVLGSGAVYLVAPTVAPATCAPGTPLAMGDVQAHRLTAGDEVQLPAGETVVPATTLTAGNGGLSPADPY